MEQTLIEGDCVIASQIKYDAVRDAFKVAVEDAELVLVTDEQRRVYQYADGAWTQIFFPTVQLERLMMTVCQSLDFPYAEKNKQLWANVALMLPEVAAAEWDACGYIATPTGTFDPLTGDKYYHDEEHYITRRISVDYEASAKCPEWLKMLKRMVADKSKEDQQQYIAFIQAWFGLAIVGFNKYGTRSLRKMLVMLGPPRTGKTSIADVLREFFLSSDVCASNVEQLSSSFGLADLVSAKAWIADDAVGARSMMGAAVFKKLVTGEESTANIKYKATTKFRFNGPACFTSNELPKFEDETDALLTRTVILRFTKQFTSDDARSDLGGYKDVVSYLRAKGEFPGILNWALNGLRLAVENGKFIDVTDSVASSADWRATNDPVFKFIGECVEFSPEVYTTSSTLGYIVAYYAQTVALDKMSPSRAQGRAGRVVAQHVTGVKSERAWAKTGNETRLVGLRLNEEGLKWLERTKESGTVPRGVELKANKEMM